MLIKKLVLETYDLDATFLFYRDLLQLPISSESSEEIAFKVGDSELIFREGNRAAYYHFAFAIPFVAFDAALERIKTRIGLLKSGEEGFITEFNDWGAKSFYFLDNNGSILECIARNTDLDREMDCPSHLLRIAEAGLVNEKALDFLEKTKVMLPLTFYVKQKPRTDFAALGDDNGLLICAKTGRNWFPTDIASEAFAQEVTIEEEGKCYTVKI